FEERFISANDFGIFLETLADSRSEANNALHAVCREKRVAANDLRLLTDAVHTPGSLNEPNDGPRQIVVNDDSAVLKVLPLTENIGRQQPTQLVGGRDFAMLVVADRAELPGKFSRILGVSCGGTHSLHSPLAQLLGQIVHRIGKLGEHEHLLLTMRLVQQL